MYKKPSSSLSELLLPETKNPFCKPNKNSVSEVIVIVGKSK
tara:strand:+ start:277 stop:399 length:123 start_codon:yes stop_codon:yes gene_type:complete